MTAYREIIKTKKDIAHISDILNSLKTAAEVIIIPLQESDEKGLKKLQIDSMAKTWDNEEDEAWDEL